MESYYSKLILTLCVCWTHAQGLEIPHEIGSGTKQGPVSGEVPLETTLMRVTFTIEDTTITLTAVARTLGFVGFGFSNSTGFSMDDADIFIAGLRGAEVYSKDYLSRGHVIPIEDASQDWELLSASESSGETTIVFKRLLNTGDMVEDIIIEDKYMRIMWAIGTSDNIDEHTDSNRNRGTTWYNLIQALPLPTTPPPPTTTPPPNSVMSLRSWMILDTVMTLFAVRHLI